MLGYREWSSFYLSGGKELNEGRKKRKGRADHKDGMGDPIDTPQSRKTADRQSLGGAVNRVSSTKQKASEDTRTRFADLREMPQE